MTSDNLTVWYIGYGFWLGFLLVVVAAAAAILHLARAVGDQSREIAVVLNACRRHTDTMPTVEAINDATRDVARNLQRVRTCVEGAGLGGER